jgi:colanic acid biosynthesis glycosyl transferase WcaI
MQKSGKVVVVSQHYPPDQSTTAAIMAAIAGHLAGNAEVLVLSGWPGSASTSPADRPQVAEIKNWMPGKAALLKRAAAELLFTARTFFAAVTRLKRGDVMLTVTAPFMLPYAAAAAARLKGAHGVLILHDLYPDALVIAGLLKSESIVTRSIRVANSLLFRALDAVITIGRDTDERLLRYGGMTPEKINFIPNWATLTPDVRPISAANRFRPRGARFVVGLSGNLGFTHDPVVVAEAVQLLRDADVHFLLSGWGVGFDKLKDMLAARPHSNVTLVERVLDKDLTELLSAADIWLIPYRKDMAGVSIPSRFYNLLAVGRPVIIISEPEAEVARTIAEHGLGWVVTPGRSDELAEAIRVASTSVDSQMLERAVEVAKRFSFSEAMARYSALIQRYLRSAE